MDGLFGLYFKIKASFAALLLLTVIYLVVWTAWLWPTFPYPGVSWHGDPWVNFRQWIFLTIAYAVFFAILSAFRNKWLRDAEKEETRRYGTAITVTQEEKRKPVGIDEAMKKVAREVAEEVAEEKEKKEGDEK